MPIACTLTATPRARIEFDHAMTIRARVAPIKRERVRARMVKDRVCMSKVLDVLLLLVAFDL